MKRVMVGLGVAVLCVGATLPAMAQNAGQNRVRPVMGRITAKGENTIDIQTMGRGGRGGGGAAATPQTIKLTVDKDTKLYKNEQGALADLTVGYVVVVRGQRDGNKVTARSINRMDKPAAELTAEQWTALEAGVQGGFGGRRGQGAGGGGATNFPQPVVGIVTSTTPLKVKTKTAEEVEVAADDQTRVMRRMDITFADLAQDANVNVLPKEAPANGAAVAASVTVTPAGAAGAGGNGGRRGGRRGGNGGGGGGNTGGGAGNA